MKYKCHLKEVREAKGLSRGALARKSGVSPQAICYIEAGVRVPKVNTLGALAEVLGVEMSDLVEVVSE